MVAAFGNLLREIRKQNGYRQEDLARQIDADQTTVSDWETDRKNPSRSRLDDLTRRLPGYTARLYVAARFLPVDLGWGDASGVEFGDLIRQIRALYGFRQIDLAEAIGTHRTTISDWERAKQTASRACVENLAVGFPWHRSRLYLASRLLPLDLDAGREEEIRRVLEETLFGPEAAYPQPGATCLIGDIISF